MEREYLRQNQNTRLSIFSEIFLFCPVHLHPFVKFLFHITDHEMVQYSYS
jgi:hypothetical protein